MSSGKTAVWTDAYSQLFFHIFLTRWNSNKQAASNSCEFEAKWRCHCTLNKSRGGGGSPQSTAKTASRYLNRRVLFLLTKGQETSYVAHHSLGSHSRPPFYCLGTAIVLTMSAWRGVGSECVWMHVCLGLGGSGKSLCGHVYRGEGT